MNAKQQRDLSALEGIYALLLGRFKKTTTLDNRALIARQIANLSPMKQRILGEMK